MSEPDWLDISDAPAAPQLPAILKNETKYQAMVTAMKKCSAKQRLYLSALMDACFDEQTARALLKEKGTRISWQAVRKWAEEPWFKQALDDAVEYACAATGVSHVGVLTQLQRAVRINGRTVKRKTELGEEYQELVNATALNHSLDRLGRRVKMFGEESETPRGHAPTGGGLHITFVHNAAPQPVNVGQVIDAHVIDIPTPKEISK